MRLIIVRHAESGANAEGRIQGHANFTLNDKGRAQAARLRAAFERETFMPRHIYSSPLARCAETADIAMAYLSHPKIEYWDDLKEYDMGAISGLTLLEAAQKFPHIDLEMERLNAYSSIPGVEASDHRQHRAQRVVQRVLEQHDNDAQVLLVSHGGIIQYILGALLGTDRIWGLTIHNTAIFEFTLEKSRWPLNGHDKLNPTNARIIRFNDARHLDGETMAANVDVGRGTKG